MNIARFKKMSGSALSILVACAVVLTSVITTTIQSKAETPSITDPKGYSDDFDSYADGTEIHKENGWISECRTNMNSHIVTGGALKVEDFSAADGWRTNIINRPISESMLNQRVKVDVINFNDVTNSATSNIHLRMQYTVGDRAAVTGYNPGPSNGYIAMFAAGKISVNAFTGITNSGTWSNGGTKKEIATAEYEHNDNHTYAIEFIVQGAYPTTLTANIYDTTANKIVATVTTTDNTDALQQFGTVGLSHTRNGEDNSANRHFALFDNFVYDSGDTVMANDNFNRTDTIGNDWNLPTTNTTYKLDSSSKFDSEYIYLKHENINNGTQQAEHESAFMRPMSESTLDSTVEIEYGFVAKKENIGVALYSRVQGDRPTDTNNYRVTVHISDSGTNKETVKLWAGNTVIKEVSKDYSYATVPHRLSMTVKSVSTTETEITVFSYKWEVTNGYGGWKRRVAFKVKDDTESLQTAGTAGFSIFKKWNSSEALINEFSYTTIDGTQKPLMEVYSVNDNFDRTDRDINGDNGWESVTHSISDSHEISNNQLKVTDFKYSDTYIWNGACTAVTARPSSESFLNQKASVEFADADKLINGASANLHLRTSKMDTADAKSRTSYFAEVTSNSLKIKYTTDSWTVGEVAGAMASYTAVAGHKYKVEFTAEDLFPTKLTATLYDIDDNNTVVATVSGESNVEALQRNGVAALSMKGSNDINEIYFDNFSYRQADSLVAQDKFNRSGAIIGNDWVFGSKASAKFEDGHLVMGTTAPDDQQYYAEDSALMRPSTETALNQLIQVDFKRSSTAAVENMGAVVYARVQGDTVTAENNYRAAAVVGWNGAGNWDGRLIVNSGTTELANEKISGMNPNAQYRLQLAVSSVSETQTQVVATLYILDNNIWNVKIQKKYTDANDSLQSAGTSAISVYDKWRKSIDVSNYTFAELPARKFFVPTANETIPLVVEDDFSTFKDSVHKKNGWIDQQYLLSGNKIANIVDGQLVIDNPKTDFLGVSNQTKILRPMSEATLNQKVSVDILNLGEIQKAEIDLRLKSIDGTSDAVSQSAFYTVEVTKTYMRICTSISWVSGKLAGTEYNIVDGHTYRLVATAQGSLPTVITATLYDVTDNNKEIASLVASDESIVARNKRTAQLPGTVGVTGFGDVPVILDNFKYEQMDAEVCHDIFSRPNGEIANDWVIGSGSAASVISDGKLSISNAGADNMWTAALMRPMSEAILNQSVRIQFTRPEVENNLAQPIVFARSQTGTPVQLEDGKTGFATYYATIEFTGEWTSDVCIYKVDSNGVTTELLRGVVKDYGKKSDRVTNLVLLAEENQVVDATSETKPSTKLTVLFYTDNGTDIEQKYNMLYHGTVVDSQPELQKAGTAGVSYNNSNKKCVIEKFSYLKMADLPDYTPDTPADLEDDYMVFFNGTASAGEFGQWMELDPSKTYVFTVRWKAIASSGGFGARLRFQPYDWGPVTKVVGKPNNASDKDTVPEDIISNTYDEETMVQTIEFKIPTGARVQPNGKVKIRATIHEGGMGTYVYATDFLVYAKDDAKKTNLLKNADFKKGFFGWSGHGNYPQAVSEAGVMVTPGIGEAELVKLDKNVFVKDDSDKYFNDGEWAKDYVNGSDLLGGGNVTGTLLDVNGKPMANAEVLLDYGLMTTKTDKDGKFEFINVPAGSYFLSIRLADGTECDFDETIEVEEEQTVIVNMVYDVETEVLEGEVEEEEFEEEEEEEYIEDEPKKDTSNKKQEANSNLWWIILIIVGAAIIVVGGVILLIILLKKKRA